MKPVRCSVWSEKSGSASSEALKMVRRDEWKPSREHSRRPGVTVPTEERAGSVQVKRTTLVPVIARDYASHTNTSPTLECGLQALVLVHAALECHTQRK